MRIAIAGGTGRLGRQVAEELRSRGHEVRVLSRSSPEHRVDLTTGEGLAAALGGCDVVVDASNNASRKARDTLVAGSERLLAAERDAGVGHHVCVSIVGCDRVPIGYYAVKTEQERVVEQGPVPWTILRATQFHEYVAELLAAGSRLRVLPLPRAKVQPVAVGEVARAVADVAAAAPLDCRTMIAGPEVLDLRDAARTWRRITGTRTAVLPIPLPGKLGKALRDGDLTTAQPDVRGVLTFESVLTAARR